MYTRHDIKFQVPPRGTTPQRAQIPSSFGAHSFCTLKSALCIQKCPVRLGFQDRPTSGNIKKRPIFSIFQPLSTNPCPSVSICGSSFPQSAPSSTVPPPSLPSFPSVHSLFLPFLSCFSCLSWFSPWEKTKKSPKPAPNIVTPTK